MSPEVCNLLEELKSSVDGVESALADVADAGNVTKALAGLRQAVESLKIVNHNHIAAPIVQNNVPATPVVFSPQVTPAEVRFLPTERKGETWDIVVTKVGTETRMRVTRVA